jgi:hypothetical protein
MNVINYELNLKRYSPGVHGGNTVALFLRLPTTVY